MEGKRIIAVEWEEEAKILAKVDLERGELLQLNAPLRGEGTLVHFIYDDGSGESVEADQITDRPLLDAYHRASRIADQQQAEGALLPFRQMGFQRPLTYELFRLIAERRSFEDPEALREWMSENEEMLLDSALAEAVTRTEDWAGEDGLR